jgi:hypothetical protein
LLAGIVAFLLSNVFYVEQPGKPPPASIAADEPRRWPIYVSGSALKNLEIFDRRSVRRTPFRNASIHEPLFFNSLSIAFAPTRKTLNPHGFRAISANKISRGRALLSKAK